MMEDLTTGVQLDRIIKPWLEDRGWVVEEVCTMPDDGNYSICYKSDTSSLLNMTRKLYSIRHAAMIAMDEENKLHTQAYVNDMSLAEIEVMKAAGDLYDSLGVKESALASDLPLPVKEIWLAMDKLMKLRMKDTP